MFLCGDVMTGRGIDQALPYPCDPVIYEQFVQVLRVEAERPVEIGVFGAEMAIRLINDGPVTLILDSSHRV